MKIYHPEIPQCRSLIRIEKIKKEVRAASKTNKSNHSIENIWEMKQPHVQNQLDIYHSYLVPSDWRHCIKLYQEQNGYEIEENIDEEKEVRISSSHQSVTSIRNQIKQNIYQKFMI